MLKGSEYEEHITLDDDDDVIVIPQEEPVITEIPDDDDDDNNVNPTTTDIEPDTDNPTSSSSNIDSDNKNKNGEDIDNSLNNESDVQILEPQISIMDLDEIEDVPENSVSSTTLDDSSQLSAPVKIKQEPKYEGYEEEDEDDGFEDVGTFEAEPVNLLDEGSGK